MKKDERTSRQDVVDVELVDLVADKPAMRIDLAIEQAEEMIQPLAFTGRFV